MYLKERCSIANTKALMVTPNFSLPELTFEQSFKEVDHNTALRLIDGLLSGVSSRTLTTPPAIVEGRVYIIPQGATGAWAGHTNKVAIAVNGAWELLSPSLLWGPVWSNADSFFVKWTEVGWVLLPNAGDMTRGVYDTNNNGIVDQSESIAGDPSDDTFYGKIAGNKGFFDFFARTRLSPLTGLSTTAGGAITATDTILQALGKLQNSINNTRGTILTGLSTTAGGAITATDTILQAFGKLQNSINNTLGIVLTGLSTTTGGTITATDTILQAFGKLQNSINNTLETVLTGLSTTTGGTITATDTILQAFGKLQNQVSSLNQQRSWPIAVFSLTASDPRLEGASFPKTLTLPPFPKQVTINRVSGLINSLSSGGATISIQNGGTAISGLSNLSCTTTVLADQLATANNVINAGGRLVISFSSITSMVNLSFRVDYTETL